MEGKLTTSEVTNKQICDLHSAVHDKAIMKLWLWAISKCFKNIIYRERMATGPDSETCMNMTQVR